MKYDFHNKTFRLLQNSEEGEVNNSTSFLYSQDDNLVTAEYGGGTVHYGKIIANLKDDQLNMLYQCITKEGELRAGKATANISKNDAEKIILSLNWQWITGEKREGKSIYVED